MNATLIFLTHTQGRGTSQCHHRAAVLCVNWGAAELQEDSQSLEPAGLHPAPMPPPCTQSRMHAWLTQLLDSLSRSLILQPPAPMEN